MLDRITFRVEAGEILAVVGPSGAGKSTLAQCINLLTPPTSGSVVVNGEDLTTLSARKLRVARRRIGTVFQSAGLLERRTAAENVALPLEYLGVTAAEATRRVAELLDRVGLAERAEHYPFQLSGGQRQRVGIARALALRPSVLLSDEATAGLDPTTTDSVVELLRELRDDLNLSIVFITHEMDTVLKIADSVARLDHGSIVESGRLVDLLTDPGRRSVPSCARSASDAEPAAGQQIWHVVYDAPTCPRTGSRRRRRISACRCRCWGRRFRWWAASASAVRRWAFPPSWATACRDVLAALRTVRRPPTHVAADAGGRRMTETLLANAKVPVERTARRCCSRPCWTP